MSEQKEFPISDEHRSQLLSAALEVSEAYKQFQNEYTRFEATKRSFHITTERIMKEMELLDKEPSGVFDITPDATKFIRLSDAPKEWKGQSYVVIEDQRDHCHDAGDVTGS